MAKNLWDKEQKLYSRNTIENIKAKALKNQKLND